MLTVVRTASIMPGKATRAMNFAHKAGSQILTTTGVKLQVMLPIGGNPSRMAWHGTFDTLGSVEAFLGKLLADRVYQGILEEFGDVFVPGCLLDEIWTTV